jgi:hypothetical protein
MRFVSMRVICTANLTVLDFVILRIIGNAQKSILDRVRGTYVPLCSVMTPLDPNWPQLKLVDTEPSVVYGTKTGKMIEKEI